MQTLSGLNDLASVIQFVAWATVVVGVRHAVFNGFVAAELGARFKIGRVMDAEANRLRKEIANRAIVPANPMQVPTKLSGAEVRMRQERLREIVRGTLWLRALRYFLGCGFCQCFWVSLCGVVVFGAGVGFWSDSVPSAFLYATAPFVAAQAVAATAVRRQSSCGAKR